MHAHLHYEAKILFSVFNYFLWAFSWRHPCLSTPLHHPPVAPHSHRQPHGGAIPSTRHRLGGRPGGFRSPVRGGWWRRRGRRFLLPARHSELTPMLGGLWTVAGRSVAVPPHLAEGAAGEIRGTLFWPGPFEYPGTPSECVGFRKLSECGVLEASVSPDCASNRLWCCTRRRGRTRLVPRTDLPSVPHMLSTEPISRGLVFPLFSAGEMEEA